MVTPYFSELCHGHTCLLNEPYPNCRSKNRGTQSFELLHNGLLTSFLDELSCSLSTIITLVLL
ncbi:unnamed protein product [Callosobruchus maculatus]|uniref:Uncharacterized protein n=1 Tax=Callosobruchus maculatus TaxID=64391 RepID=A0A653DDW2_CALMS|nr:unnamed protein product [Callosobruchus maculatus]